jgi:hypothetical protein
VVVETQKTPGILSGGIPISILLIDSRSSRRFRGSARRWLAVVGRFAKRRDKAAWSTFAALASLTGRFVSRWISVSPSRVASFSLTVTRRCVSVSWLEVAKSRAPMEEGHGLWHDRSANVHVWYRQSRVSGLNETCKFSVN